MSGFRGKRKEENYALEGDSEGHEPTRKKTFKKDSFNDSIEDIVVCEISKNRRVTVRNWQGKVVVDIREFYVRDGKELPGK
ncbi:RNA polymerase II transcriptional coactivator KIWI [Morella rubra]|uniref:RNA polymerase II transcriptional coactivator KIWI n=1 Tax=Morella rubra TaxID=262757 RepID=A0A6A1VZE9_9ROSI|nr:RNA polymerase II transcriptional coactivator KIWI [Morella rubra]